MFLKQPHQSNVVRLGKSSLLAICKHRNILMGVPVGDREKTNGTMVGQGDFFNFRVQQLTEHNLRMAFQEWRNRRVLT